VPLAPRKDRKVKAEVWGSLLSVFSLDFVLNVGWGLTLGTTQGGGRNLGFRVSQAGMKGGQRDPGALCWDDTGDGELWIRIHPEVKGFALLLDFDE
jgi:hypothetical protein